MDTLSQANLGGEKRGRSKRRRTAASRHARWLKRAGIAALALLLWGFMYYLWTLLIADR